MKEYYFAGIVFFTYKNIKGQNMLLRCVSQNFRRSALCKNINFFATISNLKTETMF